MAFKTDFTPGKLELSIIQGKNIIKEGMFGPTPDPLIVLYFNGLEAGPTKVLRGTVAPLWQDSIEIMIPEAINYEECDLKLVLYDAVGGKGEKVDADDDTISTAGKKKKKK